MKAATTLRHAAADLGRAVRLPPLATLVEWAARVGYGARGFVYLSAGALTLLAATDRIGEAVGTSGAAGWLGDAGGPGGQRPVLRRAGVGGVRVSGRVRRGD